MCSTVRAARRLTSLRISRSSFFSSLSTADDFLGAGLEVAAGFGVAGVWARFLVSSFLAMRAFQTGEDAEVLLRHKSLRCEDVLQVGIGSVKQRKGGDLPRFPMTALELASPIL